MTIRRGDTYQGKNGRWAVWEAVDAAGNVCKIEIYKPKNTLSRMAAKARLKAWINNQSKL